MPTNFVASILHFFSQRSPSSTCSSYFILHIPILFINSLGSLHTVWLISEGQKGI